MIGFFTRLLMVIALIGLASPSLASAAGLPRVQKTFALTVSAGQPAVRPCKLLQDKLGTTACQFERGVLAQSPQTLPADRQGLVFADLAQGVPFLLPAAEPRPPRHG